MVWHLCYEGHFDMAGVRDRSSCEMSDDRATGWLRCCLGNAAFPERLAVQSVPHQTGEYRPDDARQVGPAAYRRPKRVGRRTGGLPPNGSNTVSTPARADRQRSHQRGNFLFTQPLGERFTPPILATTSFFVAHDASSC